MLNYLANSSGTSYGGSLSKLRDVKAPRTIETQFLDGSFNLQTIGTTPRRLTLEYIGSHETRLALEALAEAAGEVKAYWRDTVYTGNIVTQITWDRYSRDRTEYAEIMTFQVLVTAEAAR